MELLVTIVATLIAGGAGYYGYKQYIAPRLKQTGSPTSPLPDIRDTKDPVILESATRAKELVLEAKDEAYKIKKGAEDEARSVRDKAFDLEKRLVQREEALDKRYASFDEREKTLTTRQQELDEKLKQLDQIKQEQVAKLERVAGLTKDEAKKFILEALDGKLKEEKARMIRDVENEAREESAKKAKEILVDAMKHGATDYVPEYTVSIVKLADEEMKGRIIGKEGRNIKALELATGVDFDIDETPGEIRLSCFDPIRREIARVSLEKLMKDGRVHPGRIEEVVERTGKDIDRIIREEGEKLCHSLGVFNLPPEVVYHLGKFKYRFSYGQNLVVHTTEETKIGVKIAHEVGADPNIVKLGCLLHDIGKVITEEEGTHVELGVEFLKKFKIPEAVIACVAEHHEDRPFSSVESMIVYIADAISGSRPGARYEAYDEYIKRVSSIEQIAKSFAGVEKVFAISAGREVRVLVVPKDVDDSGMAVLAHDIAEKIHDEVTYPGSVKITVIRETRATAVAK